jgi:hypothetical protein
MLLYFHWQIHWCNWGDIQPTLSRLFPGLNVRLLLFCIWSCYGNSLQLVRNICSMKHNSLNSEDVIVLTFSQSESNEPLPLQNISPVVGWSCNIFLLLCSEQVWSGEEICTYKSSQGKFTTDIGGVGPQLGFMTKFWSRSCLHTDLWLSVWPISNVCYSWLRKYMYVFLYTLHKTILLLRWNNIYKAATSGHCREFIHTKFWKGLLHCTTPLFAFYSSVQINPYAYTLQTVYILE